MTETKQMRSLTDCIQFMVTSVLKFCVRHRHVFSDTRLLAAAVAVFVLFCLNETTYAQTISFRGATSTASPYTGIQYWDAGDVDSHRNGNVTPGLPAGFEEGDLHIAIIEQKDNFNSTMPAGWTQFADATSGPNHRAKLFWKHAQIGDTDPTVTHTGDSIIARIIGFYGVERTNPFDGTNSFTVSAADLTTEAAAITTVTPNSMLVFTAHMADNHNNLGGPVGSTPWTLSFFNRTNQGTDSAIAAYYGLRAATGSQADVTATAVTAPGGGGSTNAISHGAQIALRPALTIAKPAGTVEHDVMIASITARPSTVTLTAPAGWTLVRRVDNAAGSTNTLAIYSKVAGAAEPGQYHWQISASTGAAGGIQSFANVDTVNPIDVENGQATASALTHATPNVTTTVPDTMLVTGHAFPSAATWTPPTAMAEAFDDASITVPNAAGISIEGSNVTQAAIAATGAKTATASGNADTGATHILALRPRVHHFAISVAGGATADTCVAKSITITAQDVFNNTVTNYTGIVNVSTSSNHGDWGLLTGAGTLTDSVADDGAASYQFAAADAGVVTLSLNNFHADDLTVTVQDSTRPSTATTSITINFRGNLFVITNDAIQVAGRPQAMRVQMNTGSSCGVAPGYTGAKNLKAWLTLDGSDPGGAAPAIGALTLPTAQPGANNLSLNFAAGIATFNLSTADVGKYVLNILDDNRDFATGADIAAASATITTRPFALVVSDVKQGTGTCNPATAGTICNPGGTATSGSKFIVAADTFQATLGAYLWNSVADSNVAGGDGIPDAGATLAQIAGAGATPSYRWPTALAAAGPSTPAGGTLGTLSNGMQSGACPTASPNCFSSGIAVPNNLSYDEVGSFTLTGAATDFLNSGINLTALVFDNSLIPVRNAVVGRLYPDHFTLLLGSSVTPACGGGAGFTYMGQPNLGYSFSIEARNKNDVKTDNYMNSPAYANAVNVTMLAENNNNGTDLSARLSAASGSWVEGSYIFSATNMTFSRPVSGPPDASFGPFDALQIGVMVNDADGPVLVARDMDPATAGVCVACTGRTIGAMTKVRFGQLRLSNAHGSELLNLPIPIKTEYWSGTYFVRNMQDSCTSIAAANVAFGNYRGGVNAGNMASPGNVNIGGPFVAGKGSLVLTKPTPRPTTKGSVDITIDLASENKTYLRSGPTYSSDPTVRATFGIYKRGPVIYLREMY
jgi:hypothetical protein